MSASLKWEKRIVNILINRRVARSRLAVGIAVMVLLLILLYVSKTPPIPPYVQIQSSYSRSEAHLYFAKACHALEKTYWTGIYDQLKRRHFDYVWKRLQNGPGTVYGIISDPNSNVLAFIKVKNGEGFWILVVESKEVQHNVAAVIH